jgi:hypothetical protein
MSDHEDIIASVLAEVAPPAGMLSDRAHTPAEICIRLERVIQVASELHDGLQGKPFQWRGSDAQYGMPMARAMGLTLVTKKGVKKLGYELKPDVKPVGAIYFTAPISAYHSVYILECQCARES